MKTKRIKNLMISGATITTNNKNEASEETAKIQTVWDNYVEDNVYSATHDKANNKSMYGALKFYKEKGIKIPSSLIPKEF